MSRRDRVPTPREPFLRATRQTPSDQPSIAALERVRAFCLSLYHLAPVGYLTLAHDGRILEANYTAGCMLGLPADRLRGVELARFVSGEADAALHEHLRHVATVGARANIELRMERPTGTRFQASLESVPFDDVPDGHDALEPTILTALVDVSERRQLEGTLLEREATLRTVFATAPDGVIGVDDQGAIRAFGAGAERMFGFRSSEAIGRHVGVLFDVTSPPLGRRSSATPAGALVQQARCRRRDGRLFDAEVSVGRLAGASYAVLVVRDVSGQREKEQALEQARVLEAAGRLATSIVHDTNNLLLRVVSSVESLAGAADDPVAVRRRAEELRRLALGGAAVVRRLSSVMGVPVAADGGVELDPALASMTALAGALLGEAVELSIMLDAAGARVGFSDGHIEQIVLNLVVNARDALPHGGRVVITTRRIELEGRPHVRLVVGDDGVGMPEDVRARALLRGFTTKETGSGLGLDTVRTIVERAGGRIAIDSAVGAGTRFTLDVPEVVPVPVAEAPMARARASTILLVEGDTLVRSTLRAWLERGRHRVIEASDAEEALEQCHGRDGAIDLMITDVLPRGAELAERARERCPSMSVLFMSGQPRDGLVRGGMLAPDVFLLGKPCSERELAAALRQVVGEAGPSSILLVEDDPLNRRMLGTLLEQRGYRVQLAATVAEAVRHYRRAPRAVDVVLADGRLPDGTASDLVRALRDGELSPPVLVVSGLDERMDPEISTVLRLPRTSFLQKPTAVDDLVRGIESLRARE